MNIEQLILKLKIELTNRQIEKYNINPKIKKIEIKIFSVIIVLTLKENANQKLIGYFKIIQFGIDHNEAFQAIETQRMIQFEEARNCTCNNNVGPLISEVSYHENFQTHYHNQQSYCSIFLMNHIFCVVQEYKNFWTSISCRFTFGKSINSQFKNYLQV
ncbi:unnamed protein product [Paramecium octaurelia]|uniref:Uncharacterized protein n=1 Tax=Paramecium octaurelia TaxID=43137 RepID=A0A8S1SRB9_PAROT|nr:unnamed protein product [Paramecium octaurelia]